MFRPRLAGPAGAIGSAYCIGTIPDAPLGDVKLKNLIRAGSASSAEAERDTDAEKAAAIQAVTCLAVQYGLTAGGLMLRLHHGMKANSFTSGSKARAPHLTALGRGRLEGPVCSGGCRSPFERELTESASRGRSGRQRQRRLQAGSCHPARHRRVTAPLTRRPA